MRFALISFSVVALASSVKATGSKNDLIRSDAGQTIMLRREGAVTVSSDMQERFVGHAAEVREQFKVERSHAQREQREQREDQHERHKGIARQARLVAERERQEAVESHGKYEGKETIQSVLEFGAPLFTDIRSQLVSSSVQRVTNPSYNQILEDLSKGIRLEAVESPNIDNLDDMLDIIDRIRDQLAAAASTHNTRTTRSQRNDALQNMEEQLDAKKTEIDRLRLDELLSEFGCPHGCVVFRGDGRGPDEIINDKGSDDVVFAPWEADGTQTVGRIGATQNMISGSALHNLPTRYRGYAKKNYKKNQKHNFDFTVYAMYFPPGTAIKVSEYLEHRQSLDRQIGEDNIGSAEVVSVRPITAKYILGYRVVPNPKRPEDFVAVARSEDANAWISEVSRADQTEYEKFQTMDDLTHKGRM